MIKLLFLDIDGVISSEQDRHYNGCTIVKPECVERLNTIIGATDPEIVISSGRRKYVHDCHMTLKGFEIFLIHLGIDCHGRIADVIDPDYLGASRGELISRWIASNIPIGKNYRMAILDDGQSWLTPPTDHGIKAAGHGDFFIQTNGSKGLTDADVLKAIYLLNGQKRSLKAKLKSL